MTIGLVLGAAGFTIAWFWLYSLGASLFVAGWIVGVVGLAIHFRQVFKELRADPKELYPPAKQPWER